MVLNVTQTFPLFNGHIYNYNDNEIKFNVPSDRIHLNSAEYILYRLRNIYYRSRYSYVFGATSYKYDKNYYTRPGKVQCKIDTLVVLNGFQSDAYFGDMILGGLIRIVHIPKEILNGATITCSNVIYLDFYQEILKIFEVKNFKLMFIQQNDYVFANELYTIIPLWKNQRPNDVVHMGYMCFLEDFVKKIEKAYNTTNIKPTDFGVMQRAKSMQRYCDNFVDVYSMIIKEHKNITFKIVPHGFSSFLEATKTMKKIKWLFGPTGSNMVFPIFMVPGTTVCMYMASWFDSPIITLLIVERINFIGFMHNVKHFSNESITLNLTRTSSYVNQSLRYVF